MLCAGASLCTLASSLALEAAPALTAIGLAAFGLLLSFLCFVVPWSRVAPALNELAPAAATIAIATATTTIDPTYGFYLVLVAGFVGYAFRRPGVIGGHLALIGLALIAPILLEPEGTRKAIACALIFGPGVFAVTALAISARRSTDARDLAYREFATDALALASRIRARVGPGAAGPVSAPEWLERPAPAIPLRNVGIARVVRADVTAASSVVRLRHRLPMTAVAVTASVIAVVATTTALVRDGAERRTGGDRSPALVRDPEPRQPIASSTRADSDRRRRDRDGAASAAASAPAAGTPAPEAGESGGGGGPQPTSPSPSPAPEPPVQVRPPSGEPQPQSSTPTPVQQQTPAAPIQSPIELAQQTVAPVVPELKP